MHFSGKMVGTMLTYTKLGMKINYLTFFKILKVYSILVRFLNKVNRQYCYILFFLQKIL